VEFLRTHDTFLFIRTGEDESLAIDVDVSFEGKAEMTAFSGLRGFLKKASGPVFGHMAYRMKDAVEDLSTTGLDRIGFPSVFFFRPLHHYQRSGSGPWRHIEGTLSLLEELNGSADVVQASRSVPVLTSSIGRNEYLDIVGRVKQHIKRGDIYELNFCVDHVANAPDLDPFFLFSELDAAIGAPHAAFYRLKDKYVICMSPESFLRVKDGRMLTQPMKGTSPRFADPVLDEASANELRLNIKERAENVMAVDVARNDLSRVAAAGSVSVDRLCEVVPFSNVHQMISTITGTLREDKDHVDVLAAAFPMASMTGAPKVRAMELIEEFEQMDRGLYSGCLGMMDLRGQMDMNVVIRAIQYNQTSGAVSFMTGGAITDLSDPQLEYDEMMLKFRSVMDRLSDVE
jgi:para-aminobenzoate synthetase component 1